MKVKVKENAGWDPDAEPSSDLRGRGPLGSIASWEAKAICPCVDKMTGGVGGGETP